VCCGQQQQQQQQRRCKAARREQSYSTVADQVFYAAHASLHETWECDRNKSGLKIRIVVALETPAETLTVNPIHAYTVHMQ